MSVKMVEKKQTLCEVDPSDSGGKHLSQIHQRSVKHCIVSIAMVIMCCLVSLVNEVKQLECLKMHCNNLPLYLTMLAVLIMAMILRVCTLYLFIDIYFITVYKHKIIICIVSHLLIILTFSNYMEKMNTSFATVF